MRGRLTSNTPNTGRLFLGWSLCCRIYPPFDLASVPLFVELFNMLLLLTLNIDQRLGFLGEGQQVVVKALDIAAEGD